MFAIRNRKNNVYLCTGRLRHPLVFRDRFDARNYMKQNKISTEFYRVVEL